MNKKKYHQIFIKVLFQRKKNNTNTSENYSQEFTTREITRELYYDLTFNSKF